MAALRESMLDAGIETPSLSMLYRWRKSAGIVRHLKKTSTRAFVLPDDAPDYVLTTECGLRVKQSPRISGGDRIYIIEDQKRGNKRIIKSSFLDFLAWLETYTGTKIELCALIDGQVITID